MELCKHFEMTILCVAWGVSARDWDLFMHDWLEIVHGPPTELRTAR